MRNRNHENKFLYLNIILILFTYLIFGCNDDSGDFILGSEYVESQTTLTMVDTFTVNLSTVLEDTVNTFGKGKIHIGNHSDPAFGKISVRSYFQIGIPVYTEVLNEDVFDSLKLVLKFNNYFFGDSTQTQKFYVHQLTESIETEDDETLNSKLDFTYNPAPIGTAAFSADHYGYNDSLLIKIDNDLGESLLTLMKDNSEFITDSEKFLDYFHGLVLIPDNAYSGCITGFTAEDTRIEMYTHRPSVLDEEYEYQFYINDLNKQFDSITQDLTETTLKDLIDQEHSLSSDDADGKCYLQGSLGLSIKVDIPSLSELLLYERGTIAQALLTFSPQEDEDPYINLPNQLLLYETNEKNEAISLLSDANGNSITSILEQDELFPENSIYTFDVTQFISDELSDSYIDPDKGLLIRNPYYQDNPFDRVIINAENRNTKLIIYYLYY